MVPLQILEIITFLDLFAAGLIVPQIPYQARQLGCNQFLIGLLISLYAGFQLLSEPVTGRLSDLKGRSTTLLLSLSLSGFAYMLLGLTSSIVVFLGLRSLLGITKHTQLIAKSIAPDLVKDKNQLKEVFSRLNVIKQTGMGLGPIVGGYIVEAYPTYGFTIIAFVVSAIFAVNAGLVRKLPKEEQKEKDKNEKKDQAPIVPELLNTISTNISQSKEDFNKIDWTKYRAVFRLRLIFCFCVGIYISNFVVFLIVKHRITPITMGYLITFFSAIGSLSAYFITNINKFYEEDNEFTKRSFHVFLTLTVSLIGVLVAPTVAVYAAFIIPLGVSATVGKIFTLEMVLSETDNENKGTVLGVANNVTAILGVISPLFAGILAQVFGVLIVIYFAILLAGVGTYYSYTYTQIKSNETKNKDE